MINLSNLSSDVGLCLLKEAASAVMTSETSTTRRSIAIITATEWKSLITMGPRQIAAIFRHHFQMHFLNENVSISNTILMKYVPYGVIDNDLSLVQIMTWRRTGDKPLSEPMMVKLPTHICVSRCQWVSRCEKTNPPITMKPTGCWPLSNNVYPKAVTWYIGHAIWLM